MSNAPYLLPKARSGYRLGHGECLDHMWLDGLQDAYHPEKKLMVCFGELAAKHWISVANNKMILLKNRWKKPFLHKKRGLF